MRIAGVRRCRTNVTCGEQVGLDQKKVTDTAEVARLCWGNERSHRLPCAIPLRRRVAGSLILVMMLAAPTRGNLTIAES
jgi:hypothetical protein